MILPWMRSLLVVAALCGTTAASAAIVEQYTYTDPYGATKTATADTPYANPDGTMSFALVAGIARKLEVSILDAANAVLSSSTSEVITADDRITIDGKPYYGFLLDLQAPATDGAYRIRARILSDDDQQIAEETYPVLIDRTPPTFSGGFGWSGRWSIQPPMPDDALVSYDIARRVWIDDVSDAGSGLDPANARFQSLWLEGNNAGQVALETPALVDIDSQQVFIGNGIQGDIKRGVHFPNANGRYLARFVVSDRAGNIARFDKPLYFTAQCPSLNDAQPFAVYDPDSTVNLLPGSPFVGYVPYVAGMTVKTNPVRLLLRVPRTEWWEDATFGMNIYHVKPSPQSWPRDKADWIDAQYAYEPIEYPYVSSGTALGADFRIGTPSVSSCGNLRAANLVLDPSLNSSPRLLSQTGVLQNAGTVPNTYRTNTVDTILSLTAVGEARPYEQTFNAGALGTCKIPAGATSCTVTTNYVLGDAPTGMEIYSRSNRLSSPDGQLSNYLSVSWQFDLRPPVVTEASVSEDGQSIALEMTEYATGTWSGAVKLVAAYLDAQDEQGTVHRINATGLESTDGVLNWRASVSLASLPSGIYTLRLYARDFYGNISEPKEITGHQRDVDGPSADIYTVDGDPLDGARLSSLSQVRFKVADNLDSAPVVTRVRLRGGPVNDDINLGFHRNGAEYSVEFPQMLPSIDAGDYNFTVTAEDRSGNVATTTAIFDYEPPSFGLAPEVGQDIALPIIGVAVRRPDGLWPLTTEPAVLADAGGLPLTGRSALTLTLSSDAQGPLRIGALTLQPGTSAVYPSYNFTANQSVLQLPVAIAEPEQTQPGLFGSLVVQIDRPGAPTFVSDVVAWSPAQSIEVAQSRPAFARRVETANLKLVDAGDAHCPSLIALAGDEEYRNVRDSDDVALCAVRWVSLPSNLAISTDPSRLSGVLDTEADAVTLTYQPGLLVKRAGSYAFHAAGDPLEHTIALHDPEPPVITLGVVSARAGQTDWLPDGKYPTDVGDILSGYANGRSDYKGLHMLVTDAADGTVVVDKTFTANVARADIRTNIPRIEGEQSFRVDLSYAAYPAIASSATLTFVALPASPMLQVMRPLDPSNVADTYLDGRFGLATRTEFTYDAALLGRWQVSIYKREDATTLVPLGNPTTTFAPDGSFRINLGTLAAGTYPILAEATYLGTSPDIDAAVRSLQTNIRVFDGTAVPFKLATTRASGRPPMNGLVKMALNDPRRVGDVERIDWERSRDGVTFEKIELAERYTRAFGHLERLVEAGEYWYRSTTVNRYSGATYTCEPLKLHVYDVPNFTLSGYHQTFNATPVQWTAVPENSQRPAEYRWSVRRGKYNDPDPLSFEGPTQTLAADLTGSWYVTVYGRFLDAPDVPGAWRKVSALLRVGTPAMSRPRIVGPYTVESGKTYRYSASATIPLSGASMPGILIKGVWQLPDGSTREGDTLDLTIAPEDTELRYTAWIDGYRDDTEQSTVLKLRPWEYQFPQFLMYKRLVREFDPTQYTYTIVQATGTANTGGEAPAYHWSFPPDLQVAQKSAASATISSSMPGNHPLSVRVYDTRGNQALLADTFVVDEPEPIGASLRILVGDAWNRAPATVTARWYADGLLASESVRAINVKLNGVLASDRVLSSYSFDIAQPGTNHIEVEITTSYGRTARATAQVVLVTGDLPSCTLDAVITSSLRAQANCIVPMGRLVGYRWDVTYSDTGEVRDLGLRSSAVLFSSAEINRGISRIRMIAVNDKGQQSAPAIWTP